MHILSICKYVLDVPAVDINNRGICESLGFSRNSSLLHQKRDSD